MLWSMWGSVRGMVSLWVHRHPRGRRKQDCWRWRLVHLPTVPPIVFKSPSQNVFPNGIPTDLLSISFPTLLSMLPDGGGSSCDSCNIHCTGHYVTDIPTLLELPQNNQAIRSLPLSIISEEAFKKGAEQIDTIAQAKKCCLSFKKVEIRLNHLTRKQTTRAKAVEKARKTRQCNKAKQKQKRERESIKKTSETVHFFFS